MKNKLEIRTVNKNEALTSREIIRKINKETGITQKVIQEVLDCFVDIYTVEVLTTGAWSYPGLGSVQRYAKKETLRKNPQTGEQTLYPPTCYLRAKISPKINQYHKMIFRELNNEKNGTTKDNWYKDRVLKEFKK